LETLDGTIDDKAMVETGIGAVSGTGLTAGWAPKSQSTSAFLSVVKIVSNSAISAWIFDGLAIIASAEVTIN